MAAFCYFYRMTPDEYRRLRWKDFGYLAEFMHEELTRRANPE